MSARVQFQLGNVPYVNARLEFAFLQQHLGDAAFQAGLRSGRLEMAYWTWLAPPHELVTDLVRRLIVAVESYVVGAVRLTAANAGRWSEELEQKLDNPFKLKARGAADAYYNKVPALVSADHSMSGAQPGLWCEVAAFYRDTRNPLFHGYVVREFDLAPLLATHELIGAIYGWIDSWSTY